MTSGRTPWWRQRQRERFARAVDAQPEPAQTHDPKLAGELAVVLMLRRTAAATSPDAAARERMRTKLFEQLAEPEPMAVTPSPVPRRAATAAPARKVTGPRGRLAIAMAAAFCLVLVLSGMTLFLSRDALPGDPLYAVRRTVESASLGLTMGNQAKGMKHLEFAADRIGDVQSLAARYPDLADSPVGDYLTAFADFDSDATAGTADLTGYASTNGPSTLTTLHDWAVQQSTRIEHVRPGLPTAARTRADRSRALLARIVRRADALAARDNCYTVTSGSSDALGVLPATGPCDKAPGSSTIEPSPAGSVFGSNQQVPPARDGGGTSVSGTRNPVAPPATLTFTTPTTAPPPNRSTAPMTTTPAHGGGTITVPLPLPGLNLPGLLPGLPGIRIGQ
ncbi:MAG TPA: DUF5667 domain-containing protein [Pseudonocardiaceae bacterium]|nr:DUF5667 domain-containing protein [Pseudonocardiaceae bacterium]